MSPKNLEPKPTATSRYIRIAPSKARRYVNLIVGKKFETAMAELKFMPSPTAKEIRKILASAGANAEENCNIATSEAIIKTAYVDQGPTLRRWLPRAMGRATRIRKRTSHITIVLAGEEI